RALVIPTIQDTSEDCRRNTERGILSRRDLFEAGAIAAAAASISGATTAAAQPSSPSALPSKSVKVGDFSQNVVDVGAGPAVLMLHGFPNNSTDWRYQIPELVKAGYRVI